MTKSEAVREQRMLELGGWDLGWYFGTDCEKCCDVYPRFHTSGTNANKDCWYECDVCGKRTDLHEMPWVARDAWNKHQFKNNQQQLTIFSEM